MEAGQEAGKLQQVRALKGINMWQVQPSVLHQIWWKHIIRCAHACLHAMHAAPHMHGGVRLCACTMD